MPRVVGVDIPSDKKVTVSLCYVYGIGPCRAREIVKKCSINPDVRAKNLTEDELSRIAAMIEREYAVEGALRREMQQNIGRLKEINCYRGLRHRRSLPVRGQRTRTNARTRKGPRKVVAGKKSVKAAR
ncbi:MAG TPA: 30S ribosomal protein S13 [Planctomycetes bacterium]|nr:30S ribosomal protein S13 [Planctomycetota bacterium]